MNARFGRQGKIDRVRGLPDSAQTSEFLNLQYAFEPQNAAMKPETRNFS